MIKKVLSFLKSKPKVHEILGKEFENKIIENEKGDRYKILSADWSGFHSVCLDKDNNPIMETRVRPHTKEKYIREKRVMIGYYLKGYKLLK